MVYHSCIKNCKNYSLFYIYFYIFVYIYKYNWYQKDDLSRKIEKIEDNAEEKENVWVGTKISITSDKIEINDEKVFIDEQSFWKDLKDKHIPFIMHIDSQLVDMNTKLWEKKGTFRFVTKSAKLVYKFPNSKPNTYIGLASGNDMDFDLFANKYRHDKSLNYRLSNQPPNRSNDDNTNNSADKYAKKHNRNKDTDRDRSRKRREDRDRDRDRDGNRNRNKDRDRSRKRREDRDRDRDGNRNKDSDKDRRSRSRSRSPKDGNRDKRRSRARSPK